MLLSTPLLVLLAARPWLAGRLSPAAPRSARWTGGHRQPL